MAEVKSSNFHPHNKDQQNLPAFSVKRLWLTANRDQQAISTAANWLQQLLLTLLASSFRKFRLDYL